MSMLFQSPRMDLTDTIYMPVEVASVGKSHSTTWHGTRILLGNRVVLPLVRVPGDGFLEAPTTKVASKRLRGLTAFI